MVVYQREKPRNNFYKIQLHYDLSNIEIQSLHHHHYTWFTQDTVRNDEAICKHYIGIHCNLAFSPSPQEKKKKTNIQRFGQFVISNEFLFPAI